MIPYRIEIEDGRLAAYSSCHGTGRIQPTTHHQTDLTRAEFTDLLVTACMSVDRAPIVGGYTFEKRDHDIRLLKGSAPAFNLPWVTVAQVLADAVGTA